MATTESTSPESRSRLLAGAASSNITPPLGVSLDGPIGQNGPATHVHDDLAARCLALSDGTTTLGIAVCDSTMIRGDVFDEAKRLVREHTGIPPENLMMTATHSHSVPRAIGIGTGPLDTEYLTFLSRRIADGIRRAVNQLAPARIGWTRIAKPEHLNNRRWLMKPGTVPPNPYGDTSERVRMNPPRADAGLLEPAGPVDPDLLLLSVRHDDGRPLAALANYGLHYVGGVPKGQISADYYGVFCRLMEDALGDNSLDPPFVAILANGASGNVNNIDFREPAERMPPFVKMRQVAADLVDSVVAAHEAIEHRPVADLGAVLSTLDLDVRRPDAARLQWARDTMAAVENAARLTRKDVLAREALLLNDYPPRLTVPMQAFRVADVGLAAIPCEVFAETGLAVKAGSPFRATGVMSLANGYHGYLPTPEQHELGGYETWPARSSCLATDAETHIRAEAVRLLHEVGRRP